MPAADAKRIAEARRRSEELRKSQESRVSSRSAFELREVPNGTGGTALRFTGFACVTDANYEMEDYLGPWVESVTSGAFRKTLTGGPDVAFLLNHQGMTLARTKPGTLKLSEETNGANSPVRGVTGLHSEAHLDPENMYVQAMRSAVERGDLDEMSFAFRVTREKWNEAFDRRWINEVDLSKGDVSLVNYGANPTTGGTVALRQRFFGQRSEQMPAGRILRLSGRSAETSPCNRCEGDGQIPLQGQAVQCPQCKGSGTGEANAPTVEQLIAQSKADTIRSRARLAAFTAGSSRTRHHR